MPDPILDSITNASSLGREPQASVVDPEIVVTAREPSALNSPAINRPKETRIIAMMNQKGGVGKTTSTVNLGAALADAGYKVLLIDLDPQAHLTLHVGVDPETLETSVYHMLTDDDLAAEDVVQQVKPTLWVLPAEVNLAGAETELAPKLITGQAQRILKDKLAGMLTGDQRRFDYVLIDCPPSLGLLTINALTLAREVFVPMQAHFLALQGLSKLLETVGFIGQGFNRDLRVTGIVLCMYEKQTILAQEVVGDLSEFLAAKSEVETPWHDCVILQPAVRRNIKLAECPSFGTTIFEYAPGSRGAEDYRQLAECVSQMAVAK